MSNWIAIKDELPPEDVAVLTKIDDGKGLRNQQILKYLNRFWWFPDLSMYVYYSPTHWKPND